MRSPLVFVLALASPIAIAALTHCSSEGESRVLGPYDLTITPTSSPALAVATAQATLFESQVDIALPLVAKPTLTGAAVAPYPSPLWFTVDDLHVQLEYVISNIGDTSVTVELRVDPWNEFIRYRPGVVVTQNAVTVDPSPVDRLLIVPANSRISGRVAYDDFERAGYILAMLMNGVSQPYHALDPATVLQIDPIVKGSIPSQIAGITGFTLSLSSPAAISVELEATLELIDESAHLEPDGTASKNGPPSKIYTIMPAPAAP
ncbi:MAG: hypothetical protein ACHREM_07725 [Polyangiales bacterium]